MLRVVVDTNVIVSSALKGGLPRKIWIAFREGKITLVLSSSMLEELIKVFRRPKFANLISKEETKKILLFIELFAEFVEPTMNITLCRDSADNHILSTAFSAKANFIVTGDKDLLSIKTFHKIPIITPKGFLTYL
jgi:hypothetical protein